MKLKHPATGARVSLDVTAVLAREISTVPKGEERIDWLLLTNVAVNSIDDALAVIAGYTKRWRIEEFHKTWVKPSRDEGSRRGQGSDASGGHGFEFGAESSSELCSAPAPRTTVLVLGEVANFESSWSLSKSRIEGLSVAEIVLL